MLCTHSVDRVALYRCICRYLQVAAERDERPIASAASGAGRMSGERQGSTPDVERERKAKNKFQVPRGADHVGVLVPCKPQSPRHCSHDAFSPSSQSDIGLCAREADIADGGLYIGFASIHACQ
jgi:hypothetical protein